ncbi:NAD(P)/FAD-dependent oxidoreductase [Angustibacter sp. McL0619]|uniref:NAD(P)/FAD-dependent oxidoreductase n=1 Tax=Angustibacter sp. McL0619 TaxID=3415676 RepID=UPI003CE754BA
MVWDVAVVGAGPAGVAAAAAARQAGASVLLLDRARFPRDKACGDGIAAEVLDELAAVGVDVSRVTAGFPVLQRIRLTSPGGSLTQGSMRRPVHVIPREVFDARLVAEAVRLGVELRTQRVRSLAVDGDEVSLDDDLQARVVVGADGVGSVVRRALGIAPAGPGQAAIAIRGYAAADVRHPGTQVIVMTRESWPAYAWSFPIGDGRANVGYGQLLRQGPLSREHLVAALHRLLPDVGPVEALRAAHLPLSPGRAAVQDGRVLLVGDALGLVNPLSGEGIMQAVVSGALAGRAAVTAATDPGAAYRRVLDHRLGRHLRDAAALQRLNRWPAVLDAGVRASASDRQVFDDLILFGLADGGLTPRVLGRTVLRLGGAAAGRLRTRPAAA